MLQGDSADTVFTAGFLFEVCAGVESFLTCWIPLSRTLLEMSKLFHVAFADTTLS